MIIIPEVTFFSTLKSILKIIRDDFNANTADESKTILYRSFKTSGSLERYDYYTQLKKIIVTDLDDPREFDFHMGFNMQKVSTPHCHITLPSENAAPNGLGLDEGNADPVFDDLNKEYRKVFTRRYDATYNFTLTSDNSNEVVALYHFLKSVLTQLIDHLELSNLEHVRIAGGDLSINPALVPPNVFMRNISVSFSYDIQVQELFTSSFVTKLIFAMQPPTLPPAEIDESDSNSYTLQ
jgi:hypothetical protein